MLTSSLRLSAHNAGKGATADDCGCGRYGRRVLLVPRGCAARLYRPHLLGRTWVISFMTVAELEWGMLHRNWGTARRTRMEQHLLRFLTFDNADLDLCRLWAAVTQGAGHQGRPIQTANAWIAATALRLDVPLVTNNPKDYASVAGLTVLTVAGP